MQTKPIAFGIGVLLALSFPVEAFAQSTDKPPPAVSLVLYADPPAFGDDVPAPMLSVRDSLRLDRRLEVLFFNPESPTFRLGASHASPPIDLTDVATLDQRKAVTQAVGADFVVILRRHDQRSKRIDATLYEIAPIGQNWFLDNRDPRQAAGDIAAQIITAHSRPAPVVTPNTFVGLPEEPAPKPADLNQVPPILTAPLPSPSAPPSPAVTPTPNQSSVSTPPDAAPPIANQQPKPVMTVSPTAPMPAPVKTVDPAPTEPAIPAPMAQDKISVPNVRVFVTPRADKPATSPTVPTPSPAQRVLTPQIVEPSPPIAPPPTDAPVVAEPVPSESVLRRIPRKHRCRRPAAH